MRAYYKPAPKSIWEEMFARHVKEREDLLRWEDSRASIKRTSSMETIRISAADQSAFDPDSSIKIEKGKRKADTRQIPRDGYDASSSEDDSEVEDLWTKRPKTGNSDYFRSPSPSQSSCSDLGDFLFNAPPVESVPRTPSPSGYYSSSSSQWDLLETSSVSSHSSFDHIADSDRD